MKSEKNIWAALLVGVGGRSNRITPPPNQSPSISAVPVNACGRASYTASLPAGVCAIPATYDHAANYAPSSASVSFNPVL
jgi:hypothetical protein